MTLSLFPQFFFLAPLGYVLLRGALAALLLVGIKEQWSKKGRLATGMLIALEGLTALSLALGYLTQLAALLCLVVLIIWFMRPDVRPFPLSTILLAGAVALVVFVGGAGLFAFDLPL